MLMAICLNALVGVLRYDTYFELAGRKRVTREEGDPAWSSWYTRRSTPLTKIYFIFG